MKSFKNLPGVMQVGITAGSLFLLYKIFSKNEEKEKAEANQRAGAVYNLTLQPDRYKELANNFYAMVKYGIGENKPALIELLNKMNTNADVNQLITSYGSRENYFYATPTGKKDLVQNIKEVLSKNDIDTLNNNWSKKNITYKV